MTPYRERREAGEYDAPAGETTVMDPETEPEPEAEPELEPLPEPEPDEEPESEAWLIDLTKSELIEKAQAMGISPANAAMSKAELIEAIEAAG